MEDWSTSWKLGGERPAWHENYVKTTKEKDAKSGDPMLDKLDRTLDAFQENARLMGLAVTNFGTQPKSQESLNQKIQTLISGLSELDALKGEFAETRVPLELMDIIDKGGSPYVYSKEMLEKTVHKNEEVNGKVEMYRKFRASLLKNMGEEMPEDTVKYLTTRHEREAAQQLLQSTAAALAKDI
ncbi:hypothetical protein PFISCL1PPCAC_8290 [Pristionchus fissidentatus]|uniref:Mediator of RNA polymerase II transcription subunit 10 n=1 Tax=Pristionchus fissidentatus TaxID=1538716 RepID=A0AAV5VFH7_9BILA|nr:hypothetical protein PFISCL1PPCAC_8290 [Pristionchus fissidentatus]